ncbi:hypothetical protein RRG08_013885 [Elysia crispata]|uniref:Uncharacterized protein n=1 Tax=Elysia crispata TaxID=231223 RepID=A0AAE1D0Q7_9GAST|nr:hypothetical protein RRG08_013885 [Elysia crispata]
MPAPDRHVILSGRNTGLSGSGQSTALWGQQHSGSPLVTEGSGQCSERWSAKTATVLFQGRPPSGGAVGSWQSELYRSLEK